MDDNSPIIYSDDYSDVYTFFKLENEMVCTLDFVTFINPDTSKLFLGKIHSIFFDKCLNELMVELQLFYDSKNEIIEKELIEFYMSNNFVEISVSLIQEKVFIHYVEISKEISDICKDPKEKEQEENYEEYKNFIVDEKQTRIVGYYKYELKDDDTTVQAIDPYLYDNISSWLSILSLKTNTKWYNHELFTFIVEKYMLDLTNIKDVAKCQKVLVGIINGKTMKNLPNVTLITKFISRLKDIVQCNEKYTVRDVHDVITMIY